MSKIGKLKIQIPEDVKVNLEGDSIAVEHKGKILNINSIKGVDIKLENNEIEVLPKREEDHKFQGLYRTLISNMINDIVNGYEKNMELHGVGYRASKEGNTLVLNVGYSHPVKVEIDTKDYEVEVTETTIKVKGIDREKVGNFAAKLRGIRPPDPYKAKGIRYSDEVIIKKEVKTA